MCLPCSHSYIIELNWLSSRFLQRNCLDRLPRHLLQDSGLSEAVSIIEVNSSILSNLHSPKSVTLS